PLSSSERGERGGEVRCDLGQGRWLPPRGVGRRRRGMRVEDRQTEGIGGRGGDGHEFAGRGLETLGKRPCTGGGGDDRVDGGERVRGLCCGGGGWLVIRC